MYIFDSLYGKIEFSNSIYKCMFSPEVQRLREVRLCNINSLCITGSANINRFEHSVGTAYLAQININSPIQEQLKLKKSTKENFVIAALLHDVANGPFGHSYEYIMEKQGFIPEIGLRTIFSDIVDVGNGIYDNSTPYENNFFNMPKSLPSILSKESKEEIASIVSGDNMLSKLISDDIDLDNIDNVYRMAHHMGLNYSKEAPVVLAENMYISNGDVFFLDKAMKYLEEWYNIRKEIYELLLLNPQEFAGKYMLTESMDIMFHYLSENPNSPHQIKWNFIDYELLESLSKLKEVWLSNYEMVSNDIDTVYYSNLINMREDELNSENTKKYIESLEYSNKKYKELSNDILRSIKLGENNNIYISCDNSIKIKSGKSEYRLLENKLFEKNLARYNPSQIISRLMTGDLYDCICILETKDTDKYTNFLNYDNRILIERELEYIVRNHNIRLKIGLHPILDVNKTERKLNIKFNSSEQITEIGESSNKLLIGVFVKNDPFGLKHAKIPSYSKNLELTNIVLQYFTNYFKDDVRLIPLYNEVNKYELK